MRSLIILTLLTSYWRAAAAQAGADSGSGWARALKADSAPLEGRVANAGEEGKEAIEAARDQNSERRTHDEH